MKQPLVSIILPVYNAQSHLARCLSSICAQTYQNLEIIVLNDGSKDQSLPVCEEFRKKDSRIILVDKGIAWQACRLLRERCFTHRNLYRRGRFCGWLCKGRARLSLLASSSGTWLR